MSNPAILPDSISYGGRRLWFPDVAALYVDPKGPYPRLTPHWYDEARDATTYAGPYPVVAHPPCGPWGSLRFASKRDNPDLAPLAVEQVRRWGGVLEHPRGSLLWQHAGLPRPGEGWDKHGGITLQVDQVNWGHVARKRTWLYVIQRPHRHTTMPWYPTELRKPTHWIGGAASGTGRGRVPPGIKHPTPEQRRLTPPWFAQWLLETAAIATT